MASRAPRVVRLLPLLAHIIPMVAASPDTASTITPCDAYITHPRDLAPQRSPQAVHTALLPMFLDKSVFEIGTHSGDGLACFAQVATNATGLECSTKECAKLRARAQSLREAGRRSFDVVCADYRLAPETMDADVFTWWQHPPHLWNHRVLAELRLRQMQGRIRRHALAVFLADESFAKDKGRLPAASLARGGADVKTFTVPYDERRLCCAHHGNCTRGLVPECKRAVGRFRVTSLPIAAVPNVTADYRGATIADPQRTSPHEVLLTEGDPFSPLLGRGNVLKRLEAASDAGKCA